MGYCRCSKSSLQRNPFQNFNKLFQLYMLISGEISSTSLEVIRAYLNMTITAVGKYIK